MARKGMRQPLGHQSGSKNSMYGRTHTNKDKFRKYPGHPAIDYDDFILNRSGYKRYKMRCLECNSIKGYRALDSIKLSCFKCAMKKAQKYTPIQRRIREAAKSRMNSRLRRKILGRPVGIHFKDFPWTLKELMLHLSSKFQIGMSWNNYAQWQVDHIIPESSFKYESAIDDEFKKCWNLENLQPLWKIDNLRKGAKVCLR